MPNYYKKGEEKFGFFMSLLYLVGLRFHDIQEFYRFVVDDLSKTHVKDLLDIGTGPAQVPIMLRRSGRVEHIYAIDPSMHMVRIARLKTRGLDIVVKLGSSRKVPFNRKFDMIITTLSFHHWADRNASLEYLSDFLKNGGEIRIYEFERSSLSGLGRRFASSHSVSGEELTAAGKACNLKVKRIVRRKGFINATFSRV